MKDELKPVIVLSPVEDRSKEIANSPIWKNAWHTEEVTEEIRRKFKKWFEYTVKFDGLKPVQVTKVREV